MAGLNYHKMYNNVRLLTSAHYGWRPIFLLSANIKTPRRCGRTKERGTLASKHTEHYGLNQWEANDQVLHSEFNEDNAKIDAVLYRKLDRSEDLPTFELKEASRILTIPLDGIRWDDWESISLFLDCTNSNGGSNTYYSCSLNSGKVSCYCSTSRSSFARSKAWFPLLITLLPRHNRNRQAHGIYFGNPCGTSCGECTFSDVKNFYIILSETSFSFLPGTRVVMWGRR